MPSDFKLNYRFAKYHYAFKYRISREVEDALPYKLVL